MKHSPRQLGAAKHADKHPEREYQKWSLRDLKPHPKQAELFSETTDAELQELAEDIKENGLAHAVEILPDGTIVAGHQRVRAAKFLGWKTIKCWVRTDLAEAGDAAVEARLIKDNLHRRQMSALDRARTYRRLKELEHGDDYWSPGKVRGDLRDYLAQQFGVSGRTLDRWERVLDATKPIQDLVTGGRLSMAIAGKVAGLPVKTQNQIAARLQNGECQKAVLTEFLGRRPPRPPRIGLAVYRLGEGLAEAHRDISGRIDRIESCLSGDTRRRLRKGQKLIRRLLSHDDANRKQANDSEEELPDANQQRSG